MINVTRLFNISMNKQQTRAGADGVETVEWTGDSGEMFSVVTKRTVGHGLKWNSETIASDIHIFYWSKDVKQQKMLVNSSEKVLEMSYTKLRRKTKREKLWVERTSTGDV